MRTASGRVVPFLVLAWSLALYGQQSVTAADAKSHIGQQTTVCGNVAGVHYASRSRGEPTFINLDKPYPNQVFTILIWGSDRPKFGKSGAGLYGQAIVRLRTDNHLSGRARDRCS